MHRYLIRTGFIAAVVFAIGIFPGLVAQPAKSDAPQATKSVDDRPYPRKYSVNGNEVTIHQPQLDSWQGNVLKGRAAVSIKTGETTDKDGKTHDQIVYGVVWFSARTEIDKEARDVLLDDLVLERASFPTDAANQDKYLGLVRQILPDTTLTADLDHLEANLAMARADAAFPNDPVKNDAPQIIFSFKPALLALIDGKPVLKPSGVAGVNRVINTKSLILSADANYYLRFADRWASAAKIEGPWAAAAKVPAPVDEAMAKAVAAKIVDVMDKPDKALQDALDDGQFPEIHVATAPTELINIDGDPQFEGIVGTRLSFITNTGADVFINSAEDNAWYTLISGRWFKAASDKGPWAYVAGRDLPGDFAQIPPDSPKSAVLASIQGTPEARESLIANSIPQTASVDRTQAHFTASYDGAPQFTPIDGTPLAYARNSAAPVIRVTESSYYAVYNGVWFDAPAPNGPWQVSTSVPEVIYTIPTNSPMHYITYVRVYGGKDNQVYVGYTPGYYGTVVSDGVVVYGTGYACDPWVGLYWYGCPATYGFGVTFGWDPYTGWAFGFGWGWAWASAWYGPWWGPAGWWAGYYPWGYWGGGIAVANVYGHWGNRVVAGTGARWANPWTGNYGGGGRGGYYNTATGGRGYGYGWRNTNIYTGTTSGAAGGVRYNPQTGRVVGGNGAAAYNPYTGNAAAGGSRTTVNTDTGRVTNSAGAAGRSNEGAGAVGGFNTSGKGGDAKGAGYVHYDRATGDVNSGGVVKVGDDVYAGRDGNVYHYDDGKWQSMVTGGTQNTAARNAELEQERQARNRGEEREGARAGGGGERNLNRSSFDRGSYGGNFHGQMGGYRGGGGGRRR